MESASDYSPKILEGVMTKFLYIINYWVPGHSGVINLIAGSDREAYEIIAEKKTIDYVGEYYSEITSDYEYDPKYAHNIVSNILKAQRFPLGPVFFGSKCFFSGIVYFISTKINDPEV